MVGHAGLGVAEGRPFRISAQTHKTQHSFYHSQRTPNGHHKQCRTTCTRDYSLTPRERHTIAHTFFFLDKSPKKVCFVLLSAKAIAKPTAKESPICRRRRKMLYLAAVAAVAVATTGRPYRPPNAIPPAEGLTNPNAGHKNEKIDHFVVLFMENRTPDHIWACTRLSTAECASVPLSASEYR